MRNQYRDIQDTAVLTTGASLMNQVTFKLLEAEFSACVHN